MARCSEEKTGGISLPSRVEYPLRAALPNSLRSDNLPSNGQYLNLSHILSIIISLK